MHHKIRFILAIIIGVVAGGTIARAIEALGQYLFEAPVSPEHDIYCAYLDSAPPMALVFPVLAWLLGAFTAGVLAKLMYRRNNKAAFIAGVVLLIFILAEFFIILCHPLWMQILGAIVPVPLAMVGSRLLSTR